jgi:NAD(P)-dependent dehydrogenase (short-subunit alcohol dehydrogenase family)
MGFFVYGIDLPRSDITNRNQIANRKRECLERYGPPEVIVLNAAIDNPPGSEASFHGNLERIIDVNLIGACNVVESFLHPMIENGGGVIVGISSIMGHVGADWRNYPPGWEKPVGYNLSKAALEQYARSLMVQYGRFDIRACCIGFGPYDGGKLDKEFIGKFLKNVPLGRPVSKESAKAALRFAVECPEFAGQTLMVEGGYLSL